ncbi:MAG: MarR family winged helix-turn-helix transcriptional regulator [Dehalobacterium sp.]
MEDTFQEFDFLLQSTNYLMNQITRKFLEEQKLSLPRFWVLMNVNACRGITMGELQNKMFLAPSSITSLVDSLVDSKLLRRGNHPEDRRVIKLFITEEGKKILEEVCAFRYQNLEEALKKIPPDEYPVLIKALEILNGFLKAKQSSEPSNN